MLAKMSGWNESLYGDLSYILGYITCGASLQLVAIEKKNELRCTTPILELDIFEQTADAIKVFFNLAWLLYQMGTLSELPHPNILAPFIPDFKKKRTLVRRERVIERTIELKECNDTEDFERLVQIYQTLEHLKALGSSMTTHLQTVEEQTVKKQERLIVELSPVGYHKTPSIDKVREWLEHMLIGLKQWHALGYCHGDVSWRNIVFVPTERNGRYWMLIDMDKSHVPDTVVIEWSHKHQGQKLRMQHDLSQLGGLMETLPFALPANMKSMQTVLLTAVETSALTANAALTWLEALLR